MCFGFADLFAIFGFMCICFEFGSVLSCCLYAFLMGCFLFLVFDSWLGMRFWCYVFWMLIDFGWWVVRLVGVV